MSGPLSPKTKAIAFAATLLIVSTVLVGSAVATTNSAIQPFLKGEGFAKERPLTRGKILSLAVSVGSETNGTLQKSVGAVVEVARPGEGQAPLRRSTDAQGVSVFDLRPGRYDVTVHSGSDSAQTNVTLSRSMRLGVAFDQEGQAHWQDVPHRELERKGEYRRLLVRVGEVREGERPVAVAGARLQVLRSAEDGQLELVQEVMTDEAGFADAVLPRGGYVLRLSTENASGETTVRLNGDVVLGAVIDGDEVEWRKERPDAHRFQRGPPRGPRATRG